MFAHGALTASFARAFNDEGSKLHTAAMAKKYGELTPPSEDELEFVRKIESKFRGKSREFCAKICSDLADDPTFALSRIRTENSRVSCDTTGLACPPGMSAVSEIHNHPSFTRASASRREARILGIAPMTTFDQTTPNSFSKYDLGGSYDYMNQWLVPVDPSKLLWYPKDNPKASHLEFTK
jgi:hypothetical protein